MAELLTAEQMRAVEGTAITSGEVTGLELMERAGRGTAVSGAAGRGRRPRARMRSKNVENVRKNFSLGAPNFCAFEGIFDRSKVLRRLEHMSHQMIGFRVVCERFDFLRIM